MKALVQFAVTCVSALMLSAGPAAAQARYEVWAIDQSNSFGKTFGGTLYIYDGRELERGHKAAEATPERVDLSGAAATMCFAKTGANTNHQRYLWVADRGRNFIWSIDTKTDQVVNEIQLAGTGSDDPTPDLLATSPNGSHVFMSLRGPNPLTADPHVSTGSIPGVGVIKVLADGREGLFEALAPVTNVDAGGVERADVHALTIRLK